MAKKQQEPLFHLTIEQIAQRFNRPIEEVETAVQSPGFPVPTPEGYHAGEVASFFKSQDKSVATATAEPTVPAPRYLELRIPIGTPENHAFIRSCMGHVECALHSQRELPALRAMLAGAVETGLKDQNDRPIANQRDVIKWICREVMTQLEKLKAATESTSAA